MIFELFLDKNNFWLFLTFYIKRTTFWGTFIIMFCVFFVHCFTEHIFQVYIKGYDNIIIYISTNRWKYVIESFIKSSNKWPLIFFNVRNPTQSLSFSWLSSWDSEITWKIYTSGRKILLFWLQVSYFILNKFFFFSCHKDTVTP